MDKIMTTLKAGDYVFVQFGHNDMKPASNVPVDRYQQLLERFIASAKEKGATPVLITPVSRKSFGEGGKITNSFGDYPETVRKVAKTQNVALIDLQNMSAAFYEAIGRDKIQPAFANANEGTHHSDWGSYVIAKCIVQGIIDAKLPLSKHVVEEWKPFDPSHPDPLESFKLPPDPRPVRAQTPAGS
jgi:lysophospholipase L1-like esterase